MPSDALAEIFADDEDGILDTKKSKSSAAGSESDRLVQSFEEINRFYEQHQRPPTATGNIYEFMLCARLEGIREQSAKRERLLDFDRFGLLANETESLSVELPSAEEAVRVVQYDSVADILDDDLLDEIDDPASSIFELKHVKRRTVELPDYIASRKPCPDFAEFKPLLEQCQTELRNRKRQLVPFRKEGTIDVGQFFVLRGVLLYVAHIGENVGRGRKFNAHMRLIFENGTESDMLLRSLAAGLYKDGRRVTEHVDRQLNHLQNIEATDRVTGYVYILKSLSKEPVIQHAENLYKIGFSTSSVAKRIENAEREATYLFAPVELVAEYEIYNAEPRKLERLLHRFFDQVRLNLSVHGAGFNRFDPREWFEVPLPVVNQAIGFILSGEIVEYRYDVEGRQIVNRNK